MNFDESAWFLIESVLPDDEELKKAVLEDFIWFMNRPKKYKSDKDKIEDYVRHIELKGRNKIIISSINTVVFRKVNAADVLYTLKNTYGVKRNSIDK